MVATTTMAPPTMSGRTATNGRLLRSIPTTSTTYTSIVQVPLRTATKGTTGTQLGV